jgi:hypothetical protein
MEKTTDHQLQQIKANSSSAGIQNTWHQYSQPLIYKLVSKNSYFNNLQLYNLL